MAQIINLPIGVSTFGNATNTDILLTSLDTTNLVSIKTLKNNIWASWSAGAPDEFQGFNEINKGIGYVANSTLAKTLTLNGADLDVNDVAYNVGLSMLALPFEGKLLGVGYVPRMKISVAKTVINNIWKSWSTGAPDEFQGFTATEKNKGYVCNIESVYDSFLNNVMPNKNEGIRFNTNDNNINDATVVNGVRYTNPNGLGALSFDSVVFDPSVPTLIMFISIEGIIAKIDFPTELLGESFYVVYNGKTYSNTFIENESYSLPTLVTTTVNSSTLEISYIKNPAFNASTSVYREMNVNVNGTISVIEFATEYIGDTFTVWKDGKIGTGVFTVGTVNITI